MRERLREAAVARGINAYLRAPSLGEAAEAALLGRALERAGEWMWRGSG